MAGAGAGGLPAEPPSLARPGGAGVAPHCRALAATAIWAGRGGSTETRGLQSRNKDLETRPSSLHRLQPFEFQLQELGFFSKCARKGGNGFASRKDGAAVAARARAMANYRANAPTTPCLRSQIPLPDRGGSKNGPRLPSAGPRWGGVKGAGSRGAAVPALRPLVGGR